MPRKRNDIKKKRTGYIEKENKRNSFIQNDESDYLENDDLLIDDATTLSEEEQKKLKEEFNKEAIPHMSLLRSFAYKMTGDEFEAEDLVQETYMRAFRFFHKFEKGTNCKAWLFRIMKNLFINNYRKYQKSPAKVDYDEIENFYETIKSERTDSSDLQEKVYSSLLDDEVIQALNSLQDDFKTVIILCDIEGLSYEEIADFVNCPVGTVRSRLHRGRKLLQQKLNEYARKKGYTIET